ncbi:MAG: sulfite exporter TauE/SafE family protein [Candidatus Hodarchaeales archaeon]
MDALIFIIMFFISIMIGMFAIVGGFGGGVFLFPILIFFGYPVEVAAANSLISLFFPSILATMHNIKRKEVNFKLGLQLEIPTAIGAIIGATLTVVLPSIVIHILFAAIASIMALLLYKNSISKKSYESLGKKSIVNRIVGLGPKVTVKNGLKEPELSIGIISIILAGTLSGLIAGMFGIGAGWIKTPLMIVGFGVSSNIASATATFMIIMTSAVGGFAHIIHGNFDLIFIPMTSGLLIGAEIGCRIREHIKKQVITVVVICSLIVISLMMIITGFIPF